MSSLSIPWVQIDAQHVKGMLHGLRGIYFISFARFIFVSQDYRTLLFFFFGEASYVWLIIGLLI